MKLDQFTPVTEARVTKERRDPRTVLVELSDVAHNVGDLRAALEAAIELRDSLIVGAVEAGCTNRDTARSARLSEARVIAILARV